MLNQPFRTKLNIETAVVNLTKNIKNAAQFMTPDYNVAQEKSEVPFLIKKKIMERRQTRLQKEKKLNRTVKRTNPIKKN